MLSIGPVQNFVEKRVENTVRKGEIARFKRLVLQMHKNQGLFGKMLNDFFGNC